MTFNDKLSAALMEATIGIEAKTIGSWIDPKGRQNLFQGGIHDQWAKNHDTTSAELLSKGWGRARVYDTDVMIETNNINHIWDAIEMADEFRKNGIILNYRGRSIYLDRKLGGWVTKTGERLDDVLVRLEHKE